LKYPIGKFKAAERYLTALSQVWIQEIYDLPVALDKLLPSLHETNLGWRYRPEGWTIRQVIHHLTDSHMNCIIRFKLSLTEDSPTIRPYYEERWAELPDSKVMPIADTLSLLTGLQHKMAYVMKNLTKEELEKVYIHPEHGRTFSLKEAIGLYAWHGNHHLAHIKQAIENGGRWG